MAVAVAADADAPVVGMQALPICVGSLREAREDRCWAAQESQCIYLSLLQGTKKTMTIADSIEETLW